MPGVFPQCTAAGSPRIIMGAEAFVLRSGIMQSRIVSLMLMLAAVPMAHAALKPIDGDLKPADNKSVAVFKTTPEGELKINLYFPEGWKPGDRRAGIVFFFGGGFVGGTPTQFTSKAEYMAGRGMVAASAEYRVKN